MNTFRLVFISIAVVLPATSTIARAQQGDDARTQLLARRRAAADAPAPSGRAATVLPHSDPSASRRPIGPIAVVARPRHTEPTSPAAAGVTRRAPLPQVLALSFDMPPELVAPTAPVSAIRAAPVRDSFQSADTSSRRPATPTVATVAPPTVTPPTVAPPKAAAATVAPATVAPGAMAPGAGTLKLGGLLQAQYVSATPSARATFRLRRAELKLAGDLGRRIAWTVMFDAAKSLGVSPSYVTVDGQQVVAQASVTAASQMTQDAFVSLRLPRGVTLDAGQLRVPLGIAGTQSAGRLEIVERPMYVADRARGGSLGDVRDVGLLFRGTALRHVDVAAGVFNGSGESQNAVDKNAAKALALRVIVRDVGIAGLQLGASGVYGGRPTSDNVRRDRMGAEAQYAAHGLTIRSEYMTGSDGAVRRAGFYGHAGFRVRKAVELLGRVDVFDPDIAHEGTAAAARARDVLGGVNIALAGANSALLLDYGVRSFHGAVTRGARQLHASIQTAW